MNTVLPKIREIRFQDGEQFAMLVDAHGTPLDEPLLFCIAEVRNHHRAYNTLLTYLRAIQFFYRWCASRQIDLTHAVRAGQGLTKEQIALLAAAAARPVSQLHCEGVTGKLRQPTKTATVLNLEKIRPKRVRQVKLVSRSVASVRLAVIRDFLDWWTHEQLVRRTATATVRAEYQSWRDELMKAVRIRARVRKRRGVGLIREGLSDEAKEALQKAIPVDSPANPFPAKFHRVRNRLIVLILWKLGLRGGELLSLRTDDLNMQGRKLTVRRRPDDPKDPRPKQPNVKTRGRELEFDIDVANSLMDYIQQWRRTIPRTKRHPFLIVSDEGAPLSLDALRLVFKTLRESVTELPTGFSPHLLRHTWNDEFSEMADRHNMPAEREIDLRSYSMGWSKTSGTAKAYTQRSTRRLAQHYGLAVQAEILKPIRNKQSKSDGL